MATPEEIAEFKQLGRDVVDAGEKWFAKLERELKEKYPGEYTVIINTEDGSYVVGKTRLDALLAAEKQFPDTAKGYVRGIAIRSTVEFPCFCNSEGDDAGIS
jgi:hypothetical protein